MKTFTVRAVTWKTRSSNNIWIWKPIAPAAIGWLAISYGYGLALLPCCFSRGCARWPWEALNGQCHGRYHPATLAKDRRFGHRQHAPGLCSVGLSLSPSEALCTGSSCAGGVGRRRRLNAPCCSLPSPPTRHPTPPTSRRFKIFALERSHLRFRRNLGIKSLKAYARRLSRSQRWWTPRPAILKASL